MLRRIILASVGVALVVALGTLLHRNIDSPLACDVCYRPMHAETFYRIHLAGGETVDTCCPRCGLRFQAGRRDVERAEVTDFLTRERVLAEKAFYVEGSTVHFCSHEAVREDRSGTQYEITWDRCLPSLIAFRSREAAVTFQNRNGGVITTYAELLVEP